MSKSYEKEGLIIGRNPVLEAIKSGRTLECIIIAKGHLKGSLRQIYAKAKEKNIPVKNTDTKALDRMSGNSSHQGVAAVASIKKYSTIDQIIEYARCEGEEPFIAVADGMEDPHNLGALIRSAYCFGVHGVIISNRRSAGLTSGVWKASAGAVEYMRVCRVANIARTIDDLKQKGFWIYGADTKGTNLYEVDFKGKIALVIGSEEKGISRLVKDKCDFKISIPMKRKFDSLNASVAGAILIFQASKKRV